MHSSFVMIMMTAITYSRIDLLNILNFSETTTKVQISLIHVNIHQRTL